MHFSQHSLGIFVREKGFLFTPFPVKFSADVITCSFFPIQHVIVMGCPGDVTLTRHCGSRPVTVDTVQIVSTTQPVHTVNDARMNTTDTPIRITASLVSAILSVGIFK